jgi:hypothetical protein
MTPTILPPGMTSSVLALRLVLFVLPCVALAAALPDVPHPALVVLVVLCAAWWARTPDHPTGAVTLLLVAGWWTVHGVLDWRVLVVGVLLVAAHVVATLLSYGPATLVVDPRLAVLWARRGLLALVPMPITYVAVRGLDAALAPPWLWTAAALGTVVLLVVTARLTQPESR